MLQAPEFSARVKIWRLKPRPHAPARRATLDLSWLETVAAILKYLLIGALALLLGYALWSRRERLRRALSHSLGATPEPEAEGPPRAALPADLAAVAQALWDRGDTRGALALLYRGALARLELGDDATERECLRAAARLPQAAYLTELLRAWQAAAYAGRAPESAQRALCAAWSGQFQAPGGRP